MFVFVHCKDIDLDITEEIRKKVPHLFEQAKSEDASEQAEAVREVNYIAKKVMSEFSCLSKVEISTYSHQDAERLCADEEGWFTCLEDYVDEFVPEG